MDLLFREGWSHRSRVRSSERKSFMKTVSPASGILLGGFFAGLCDFIIPSVQFVMKGGEWYQPWKGVAGGIFGPAAREGGAAMVVVGMASHWFICIGAAAI